MGDCVAEVNGKTAVQWMASRCNKLVDRIWLEMQLSKYLL